MLNIRVLTAVRKPKNKQKSRESIFAEPCPLSYVMQNYLGNGPLSPNCPSAYIPKSQREIILLSKSERIAISVPELSNLPHKSCPSVVFKRNVMTDS
jgi:hypothetical protein